MYRPNRARAAAALGLALVLVPATAWTSEAVSSVTVLPQCDCGKDGDHEHAAGTEHDHAAGTTHDHGNGMEGMDHSSGNGMEGMDHSGHSGHSMATEPVDRPIGLALGGFGAVNGVAMAGAFVVRRRNADDRERRREARRLAGAARSDSSETAVRP